MKKIIILFSIVLSLALLYGCSKKTDIVADTIKPSNATASITSTVPIPKELKIQDYFPIKENMSYIYEGKGNEYAAYSVFNDYISEGKVQQRIDNGGTEIARVVEVKDGKLTILFFRGEIYFRENYLEAESNENEILLKEPLVKGASWTLKDSRVRTITNASADITTPSGSYKAIEVTTQGTSSKTIDYYAKNVGLVKTVSTIGEAEVSSSLSKIEENVPFVKKINFFYPNINDGKIYYESRDISFKTNDITKQILEKACKEAVSNNIGKVFTSNTKINSLYLNKDNMVYIDLNSAFLSEMNVGALAEKMILQCIANTFGQYYNVEKVVLTINNKPYESGHISMKKGEYLKVNLENSVEIKK